MSSKNNLCEKEIIHRYHTCHVSISIIDTKYLYNRYLHWCFVRTKVKNLKEKELKLNKSQSLPRNLCPSYVFQHVTECEKYPSHTPEFLRCLRNWIMIKDFLLLNEKKQQCQSLWNFPTIIFFMPSIDFELRKKQTKMTPFSFSGSFMQT